MKTLALLLLLLSLSLAACRVAPDASGSIRCFDETGAPIGERVEVDLYGDVESALAANGAYLQRPNDHGWCEIDLDLARVEK